MEREAATFFKHREYLVIAGSLLCRVPTIFIMKIKPMKNNPLEKDGYDLVKRPVRFAESQARTAKGEQR
ncbi:MAG: hypothetical protein E6593_12360 [Clostridium sp.]|uniref:hypothetical protein n=1 Tax=Faecalispora jeddahensis TaxID=1414721 RepID=UPI00145AD2F1|nr:hypothetical protein [Faecalispora jeddahensis]MDU6347537.1 hypothetical protein [Clostridium sp.]